MQKPDFIIIGAMKCGTTTAYQMLSQHPEIGMSIDKETDYFVAELNHARGPAWYASQFDTPRRLHGEASPNYTKQGVFPGVAQRIHEAFPDARLIYMVRDPVKRLVSQYRHSWIMGEIKLTPEEFMNDAWEFGHALDVSSYHRQISEYLRFFRIGQLLVVDFDELLARPDAAFANILGFIGAAPFEFGDLAHANDSSQVSRIPRSLLRLAQSAPGRAATRLVGRALRGAMRDLLAMRAPRRPPPIPPTLHAAAAAALKADADAFRALTGMAFESWSV